MPEGFLLARIFLGSAMRADVSQRPPACGFGFRVLEQIRYQPDEFRPSEG
jgi:hypothetical protein